MYDLTEKCKGLRHQVTAIYVFEGLGSMGLVTHGLIGMALVEHTKIIRLTNFMNIYTKVALVFYALCAILRTAMYIRVLVMIAPLELPGNPQDFGGFLAVYA